MLYSMKKSCYEYFYSHISFTIMSSHPFATNIGNYDEMFLTFYLGFIMLGVYRYYSYQHLSSSKDEVLSVILLVGNAVL